MASLSQLHFPHTLGNRGPIWQVLATALPSSGTVLELASGSGEHAAEFAARSPGLTWQPSDLEPEHLASIAAWTAELPNVLPPIALDASRPWPGLQLSAVLAINLIHIAPWEATLGVMAGAAASLQLSGLLYLYGAFRRNGRHTAASNRNFDEMLRNQDSRWGVRDLDIVVATAGYFGLTLERVVEMPSNNLSVLFRR